MISWPAFSISEMSCGRRCCCADDRAGAWAPLAALRAAAAAHGPLEARALRLGDARAHGLRSGCSRAARRRSDRRFGSDRFRARRGPPCFGGFERVASMRSSSQFGWRRRSCGLLLLLDAPALRASATNSSVSAALSGAVRKFFVEHAELCSSASALALRFFVARFGELLGERLASSSERSAMPRDARTRRARHAAPSEMFARRLLGFSA